MACADWANPPPTEDPVKARSKIKNICMVSGIRTKKKKKEKTRASNASNDTNDVFC